MENVWIVDFGSQYTQLITRKSRELGFSSVIMTWDDTAEKIKNGEKPLAFILSGGPQSVFEDENNYSVIFDLGLPTLGICYGMQIIGQYFGGTVERGVSGEYGHAQVSKESEAFIPNIPDSFNVWMSHFDHVAKVPGGFNLTLKSSNGMISGFESVEKKNNGTSISS